jgi:hypothetical protein
MSISTQDEEAPLLATAAELTHEAVYARFTPSQKRTVSALVSCSALVPCTAISLEQDIVSRRGLTACAQCSRRRRLFRPFRKSRAIWTRRRKLLGT